ncbi:hypothetical protein [Acetomicrobium sp.]|uniref:hypothetical protein n=1 Tax=Acetomicrobium sp. TaxID=1872099 RepID=UPI001BCB7DD7|nr:hypothetical protein [Acetomicrobium sp.]
MLPRRRKRKWLSQAKPKEIRGHIMEAGSIGLMIMPGCVLELDTPEINFYAARLAVEGL